jgi:predicted ribosomally synthesized peptide with SipW-like signal peptide
MSVKALTKFGLPGKLAASALVLGIVGAVAGAGTWSAWSATTENDGNTFQTGTVELSDNDGGSTPMFALNGLSPESAPEVRCIVVTYDGTLPADVRLHGNTTGTGLAPYLDMTVTRGTLPDDDFDCNGFTPDATNYIGAGNGVIFDGTLGGWPDDYAGGLADPDASWTNGEKHAYRIEISVQDDDNAQGKSASQAFTWESRQQ